MDLLAPGTTNKHVHQLRGGDATLRYTFVFKQRAQQRGLYLCHTLRPLTAWSANLGGVSRRWRAVRLSRALRFVLRDLARCKVRLSKPRIEPSITSQLQVEPDLQMAGVGHLGCQARARDGAWMTKLARTRAHARTGGQSWSRVMSDDRPARRSRPCALACPQTWPRNSADRPFKPGHAFSPTLSSTLRHGLVPGSQGARLQPSAKRVLLGVEK